MTVCVGCGGQDHQENTPPAQEGTYDVVPTIFTDITGIPRDKTVMTVGESEISAELYFYWFCYVSSSLEYNILQDYSKYGMYASCVTEGGKAVDWTGNYAGLPLIEYAKAQTESTIKYYMAIEELAAEKGADLTAEDKADMDSAFRSSVEEMGGQEAFIEYLQVLGISKETFDRISAPSYLYDNLLEQVFTEGTDLYLPTEEYSKYGGYADHILIATQDMKTGEQFRPEEAAKKYLLAEDLLEQIRAAEDPVKRFEELADEYSDDPGRADNPTGFIYTKGTMVPEFESAAAVLAPGEISEIVQSDYGFHIILGRDLLAALEEDESRKTDFARAYLDETLVKKRSSSAVAYDQCLDDIDWDNFYADYIAAADKIAG